MPSLSESRHEWRRRALARLYVTPHRVHLLIEILGVVKSRRLSANDVSQTLDVPEARVSALLHSDVDEFSIDELVRMIARAGVELELTKMTPVDEETFDGPLCRASGGELYDVFQRRLAAMVERLGPQNAEAPGAPREGVTLEALIERLGDAGIRLLFTTP